MLNRLEEAQKANAHIATLLAQVVPHENTVWVVMEHMPNNMDTVLGVYDGASGAMRKWGKMVKIWYLVPFMGEYQQFTSLTDPSLQEHCTITYYTMSEYPVE